MTKDGEDPLLSAEENTANLIEPPTEEETNNAITSNLANVLVLVCRFTTCISFTADDFQMKAVKAFKRLLERKRPGRMTGILGRDTRLVQPPISMLRDKEPAPHIRTTRSMDAADRKPVEQALATEGIHRDPNLPALGAANSDMANPSNPAPPENHKSPAHDRHDSVKSPASPTPKTKISVNPRDHRPKPSTIDDHGKGHAHNPLEDHLFLYVGPGGSDEPPDPPAVSESPAAAETNIYETAYSEEIERIRSRSGTGTTLYLTRRVEKKKELRDDANLVAGDKGDDRELSRVGLSKILGLVRKKERQKEDAAAAEENANGGSRSENQPGGG